MQREFIATTGSNFYDFEINEGIIDAMLLWASLDHVNHDIKMFLDGDNKRFRIEDRLSRKSLLKKGGAQ